jgi:helix-turn-helix protein
LTLAALGARAGFSAQHISTLELAQTAATRTCVAALDAALDANGALLEPPARRHG